MPKGKLTLDLEDLPRLRVAADFSDIELRDGNNLGDKLTVPFIYKSPSDIFSWGRMMDKVTTQDVNEWEESGPKKSK